MASKLSQWVFYCSYCLVLFCLVISTTGCGEKGPRYYPVEGKVVFKQDSSAAQFGSIEFRSESDPPVIARGTIQADGTFRLSSNGKEGTVQGTHSVVILQIFANLRNGERIAHDHGLEVAQKYSDHRTSDLRVDVQPETSRQVVIEVETN